MQAAEEFAHGIQRDLCYAYVLANNNFHFLVNL